MTSEVIVLKSDFDRFVALEQEFARHNLEAVSWENRHNHAHRIRYALVWKPEPGELARMPNLEVVFSVGAGIDPLTAENVVPDGVPVVRMVEPSLTAGMVEYVLYSVLRLHREMPLYDRNQKNHVWEQRLPIAASDRTVGILGLGVLGGACATALTDLGFRVLGWSRRPKSMAGVKSYYGDDQLSDFLRQSEFLVCLLPLTEATRKLVDAGFLAQLPHGAFFINAGRGPVVDEQALLAALDNGRIGAACLDVFNHEPLPDDSPFWDHPSVTLTPHIASTTIPDTSIHQVVTNIQRYRQGKPLLHVADLEQGY